MNAAIRQAFRSRAGLPALAACLFCILAFPGAAPAEVGGVRVTKILTTGTTTNGDPIRYPVTAAPEVTAALVEIAPGGETGWHRHTVPLYAYVLAGNLSVEIEGGGVHLFREGDVIIEVVEKAHNGRNTGTVPVRLAVFYTGEKGMPTTVKQEKAPDGRK